MTKCMECALYVKCITDPLSKYYHLNGCFIGRIGKVFIYELAKLDVACLGKVESDGLRSRKHFIYM